MRKTILGILVVLLIAGCKKGTTITYRVINHSGEQITFTSYYDYSGRGNTSTILNNGDTRDILILGKGDGSFDSDYKAGDGIDSITGVSNTQKRITKNLANDASWSKVTTKKQHLHSFTTEITSKDLQ